MNSPTIDSELITALAHKILHLASDCGASCEETSAACEVAKAISDRTLEFLRYKAEIDAHNRRVAELLADKE